MKMINLKAAPARAVTVGCLVGLFLTAQSALACTVDNWDANSNTIEPGSVVADGPAPVARYSGVCAMQAADATEAWVRDDSPGGINRIRARFYVLADNSGEAVVYRGLTSTDAALFGVRLNPANGDVTLTSAGVNAVCSGCANAGAWNSIEIDWNAGGGSLDLWVNSDARSDSADASAAFSTSNTVSSVRLGNLNSAAGTMNFDAYESRRTTAIGRLCVGDGNGDVSIGFPDVTEIFNEVSSAGVELSAGQPDVDEDGSVGFPDVTQAFGLVSIAASCN